MRRIVVVVSIVCIVSLLLSTLAVAATVKVPRANVPLRVGAAAASAELQTLCKAGGKLYGAGRGSIALLNEDGSVNTRFTSPVQDVAGISAFQAGKLLLGDRASKSVMVYDLASKRGVALFRLAEISQQGFAAGSVLTSGELASVASDGENVFVGLRAGFSSSIFMIDPRTRKILSHGWAPVTTPQPWLSKRAGCL